MVSGIGRSTGLKKTLIGKHAFSKFYTGWHSSYIKTGIKIKTSYRFQRQLNLLGWLHFRLPGIVMQNTQKRWNLAVGNHVRNVNALCPLCPGHSRFFSVFRITLPVRSWTDSLRKNKNFDNPDLIRPGLKKCTDSDI